MTVPPCLTMIRSYGLWRKESSKHLTKHLDTYLHVKVQHASDEARKILQSQIFSQIFKMEWKELMAQTWNRSCQCAWVLRPWLQLDTLDNTFMPPWCRMVCAGKLLLVIVVAQVGREGWDVDVDFVDAPLPRAWQQHLSRQEGCMGEMAQHRRHVEVKHPDKGKIAADGQGLDHWRRCTFSCLSLALYAAEDRLCFSHPTGNFVDTPALCMEGCAPVMPQAISQSHSVIKLPCYIPDASSLVPFLLPERCCQPLFALHLLPVGLLPGRCICLLVFPNATHYAAPLSKLPCKLKGGWAAA
eukprot:1161380-Pelagomonas_calceolata.AAC.10